MPISKPLSWTLFVKYLKDYGWFLVNSEIYAGLANSYDLGPFAVHLKTKLIEKWKTFFCAVEMPILLIDANLLLKREVLEASGHLARFHDYILTCTVCQKTHKIEDLVADLALNQTFEEIKKLLDSKTKVACASCQTPLNYHQLRQLDLLFKTGVGVDPQNQKTVYLRPETAQNIFINLPHLIRIFRLQPPFGIAQIGKVFRNEMTTEHFIFRTCEFSQLEIEFFFADQTKTSLWFAFWQKKITTFLEKILTLNKTKIRQRVHGEDEKAHYAQQTVDFEFAFPFGWKELWGLSDRGNYDLKNHEAKSGVKMNPLAKGKNPLYVIEPSVGLERLMLAILYDKLTQVNNRLTLELDWDFAYYQIAVFPLTEKLHAEAYNLFKTLKRKWRVCFDAKKSIGKRYLHHDAIGTCYAVTFDFDSVKTQTVTIRFRDTKKQVRIAITRLSVFFRSRHE